MKWIDRILDILYPPTCVMCSAGDAWLCPACQRELYCYRRAGCPRCGERDRDHVCTGEWPFASVTVCGPYGDPAWRRMLTTYKYRSAACLDQALRQILKRFRDQYLDPWPWAQRNRIWIAAIPADARRKRQRGFDHAARLADLVQEVLLPWGERRDILGRARMTMTNAKLPSDDLRAANVSGSFRATGPITEPVLLVDDVLTSGATMAEAAKILLAAGAPEVHVFCWARGG